MTRPWRFSGQNFENKYREGDRRNMSHSGCWLHPRLAEDFCAYPDSLGCAFLLAFACTARLISVATAHHLDDRAEHDDQIKLEAPVLDVPKVQL